MKFPVFGVVLCLLLSAGCDKPKEAPSSPPSEAVHTLPAPDLSTVPFLKAPLSTRLTEHPAQALPLWREYRGARPALVLISADPFLQPLPQGMQQKVVQAIQSASGNDLEARLAYPQAAPLLLPTMALSAALQAGLFSEVLWVFPAEVNLEQLSEETFRRQLVDFGAVSEEEAETFLLTEGVLAGTVRGTPFRAVHPAALPPLDVPALVHIDLSYFAPLYQGEIKTPLYFLVNENLALFKEAGWQIAAATLSRSNINGGLPLATRFLGDDLASLLADPSLLDKPMPENWSHRANALYLENFFQKEKIRDLYLEMEKAAPQDPSVKYALYNISRQFKEGSAALKYLEQAAALDPAYALEYLSLAKLAAKLQRPNEGLRMLQRASIGFPNNPFIRLQLAGALEELGQPEASRKIVEELLKLHWSPTYFPDLPRTLKNWPAAPGPALKDNPIKG